MLPGEVGGREMRRGSTYMGKVARGKARFLTGLRASVTGQRDGGFALAGSGSGRYTAAVLVAECSAAW